jgi:hypothetical protein
MSDEVPEGAAVFPLIPAALGVHPLLLAAIHSVVFLDGSSDEMIDPDAAAEALEYIATYFQRLDPDQLRRAREDMVTLTTFAREEKWPREMVQFLQSFLDDLGAGKGEDDDE